jgi:thiol-disulfide isomerase/thioredoxin
MFTRRVFLLSFALLASLAGAQAAEQPFSKEAFAAAQAADKPIVVHVYAPWCPTCRAQEPILHKLEADPKFSGVQSFRVDFDGQKDAVRALKATSQSTIVVFKGAKEVGRSVGETSPRAIADLLGKAVQ